MDTNEIYSHHYYENLNLFSTKHHGYQSIVNCAFLRKLAETTLKKIAEEKKSKTFNNLYAFYESQETVQRISDPAHEKPFYIFKIKLFEFELSKQRLS